MSIHSPNGNDRLAADATNSPATKHAPHAHRSTTTTSSPNGRSIVRQLWFLAALSFLFIFYRNLKQISAQPKISAPPRIWWNRIDNYRDQYEAPDANDDELWMNGSRQYDYLVLNMHWPVTFVRKSRHRAERARQENPQLARLQNRPFWLDDMNTQLLEDYVEEHGYRFIVHGLWAGIWGEPSMGSTRIR